MVFTKRFYATSILLCAGLAGCTPANFIQRARPAPPCDVQMCLNVGASPARCACQTHEQVQRQIWETWRRQLE